LSFTSALAIGKSILSRLSTIFQLHLGTVMAGW